MRPLGALVLVVSLAGCPQPRSTAPHCADGSTVTSGACVPYRIAEAFCGPAATPQVGGGCARKPCAPGEALDLDHGLCLPRSIVVPRLLHGLPPPEGEPEQVATCIHGALVGRESRITCQVGPLSCGRGEHWQKSADAGPEVGTCASNAVCGLDELFDDELGKCARIVRGGTVDLGAWARLVFGTDGGEGENAFCAPVRAVMPPGARAHFQIGIRVPDNDVTQTSARLLAKPPVPTAQADAAERSLEELVQILHFYGRTSLAASASLEVTCTAPASPEPTLEVPK